MSTSTRKRKSSGRRSLNNLEPEEYMSDKDILGFLPLDVVDDIINSVHDSACDIVDETEQSLLQQIAPDQLPALQQGFDEYLDQWANAIDKYCDKFELFALKNSFHIAPSLRTLAAKEKRRQDRTNERNHDRNKENFDEQHADLDQQIHQLRARLYQEKQKNLFHKQQLQSFDQKLSSEDVENLSRHVDMLATSVRESLAPTTQLWEHYQQLQQVFRGIETEFAKLPAANPPRVDVDSQFLAHSRSMNVQSPTALQELTDAMDE